MVTAPPPASYPLQTFVYHSGKLTLCPPPKSAWLEAYIIWVFKKIIYGIYILAETLLTLMR